MRRCRCLHRQLGRLLSLGPPLAPFGGHIAGVCIPPRLKATVKHSYLRKTTNVGWIYVYHISEPVALTQQSPASGARVSAALPASQLGESRPSNGMLLLATAAGLALLRSATASAAAQAAASQAAPAVAPAGPLALPCTTTTHCESAV